jgi:hypothetical protein
MIMCHIPRLESLKTNSYNAYAATVARMFVNAAIAAYLPPLALVPQIAMATKRPPTSRAVFAATKYDNGSSAYPSKSRVYVQPLLENPQIAVPLEN